MLPVNCYLLPVLMSWISLSPNAVGLAPLAGISDSPFREICREYGADFVFSEMISATGICRNQGQEMWDFEAKKMVQGSKSLEYGRFKSAERPIILQLFGHDPAEFAEAAKILVARFKPDGIDINMSCPVRKVVNGGSGVALMDQPKLAAQIVRAVKQAIGSTPLSVKTRLGNVKPTILSLAPQLEQAGADALIIHPRLRRQFFKGPLDYATVGRVTRAVSIPAAVSGGLKSAADIARVGKITHAKYFLIGQAALGNPFIFKQLKKPDYQPAMSEIMATMLRHTELQMAYRNNGRGAITEMRKHYAWYIRGFKNAAQWRRKLVRAETLIEVQKIILSLDKS